VDRYRRLSFKKWLWQGFSAWHNFSEVVMFQADGSKKTIFPFGDISCGESCKIRAHPIRYFLWPNVKNWMKRRSLQLVLMERSVFPE
jgi:hypothetical protein